MKKMIDFKILENCVYLKVGTEELYIPKFWNNIKFYYLSVTIIGYFLIYLTTALLGNLNYKLLNLNTNTPEILTIEPEYVIEIDDTDVSVGENRVIEKQIELETIKDKKEWFLKYKEVIAEYSEWIDPPETIYDYYTADELNTLFKIVEAECTGGDFISKANVASVIFNRIGNDDFGTKIHEIITEDQFSPLKDGRFNNIKVTEDTVLACEYAFEIEDTTNGALFFDSAKSSWASRNKEYLFTDSIGHKFYK